MPRCVWSAAAATGVGLVARGRLLPAASPGGYGAWRVGPLDAADLGWLRRIAAAMPPQGHALPVDQRRPLGTVASADHEHGRPPSEDLNAIGDAQD